MKTSSPQSDRPLFRQRQAAFTLVETMIASATMIIVIMALLSAHLVGLRLNQLVESKAGASDTSRKLLNQLPTDIQSAKMWRIGNRSGSTFTSIANGTAQQGNALQLFQSTNGSSYSLYYFDLSDPNTNNGKLMRQATNGATSVCLASNLVNWLGGGFSFAAENYNGVVATNQGNSRAYKNVIHTVLQFCLFQYPLTKVGGTNALYDYYKIEFRATPHLPE